MHNNLNQLSIRICRSNLYSWQIYTLRFADMFLTNFASILFLIVPPNLELIHSNRHTSIQDSTCTKQIWEPYKQQPKHRQTVQNKACSRTFKIGDRLPLIASQTHQIGNGQTRTGSQATRRADPQSI